jgi:hypothetical protein
MRAPQGLLFPDANTKRGRTDVHILSLRGLRAPVEGKLKARLAPRYILPTSTSSIIIYSFVLYLHVMAILCITAEASSGDAAAQPFHMVVFTCIYGRPLLTDFVLGHYASLRGSLALNHAITLDIFIVGSDAVATAAHAEQVGAGYAVYPNSPLGAKHNAGLAALRDFHTSNSATRPEVVLVIGSDDVLNAAFFVAARDAMASQDASDVLGLRDLYLYELATGRLVYTRGYRNESGRKGLGMTVGCGRVFSWALLDRMNWTLWEGARERSLDQSTVALVSAIGARILPLDGGSGDGSFAGPGPAAIDVKTGGLAGGCNIWTFDAIVGATGSQGPLHAFQDVDATTTFAVLSGGRELGVRLEELRSQMQAGCSADSEGKHNRYTTCDAVSPT